MHLLARLIPLLVLVALAIAAPTKPEDKCKFNPNKKHGGLVRLNCLMTVSKDILTRVSESASAASQGDIDDFARVWNTLDSQYGVLFSGIQRTNAAYAADQDCPGFVTKAKELSEHWTEHASLLPKLVDSKFMSTKPDTSKFFVQYKDNKHIVSSTTLDIVFFSYHQPYCPGSRSLPDFLKGFDPVVAFGQSCPKSNEDFKPTVKTTIDAIKEIRNSYATPNECGAVPTPAAA